MNFIVDFGGRFCQNIFMTSKERMNSWEELESDPKPDWETWKSILRMSHVNHDPKLAKQQWEKIVERLEKKNKKRLDKIIFTV